MDSNMKIGYLDPFIISKGRWAFPLKFPDNAEALQDCKTAEERRMKRKEICTELRRKVAI